VKSGIKLYPKIIKIIENMSMNCNALWRRTSFHYERRS